MRGEAAICSQGRLRGDGRGMRGARPEQKALLCQGEHWVVHEMNGRKNPPGPCEPMSRS